MRLLHLSFAACLAIGCASEDLLGPEPPPTPHFTAVIDGTPFEGFVPGGCVGTQISPTMFFLSVRVPGSGPNPELSLHLGGITGPARMGLRPNEPQQSQRAALYIPGDPAVLQYSAPTGSGEIVIDHYDAVQRTVAGRFYFNAYRAVGTVGSEWIEVRQGSFRGTLRAWGTLIC